MTCLRQGVAGAQTGVAAPSGRSHAQVLGQLGDGSVEVEDGVDQVIEHLDPPGASGGGHSKQRPYCRTVRGMVYRSRKRKSAEWVSRW